ncbi:hypothetical protein [Bacillus infantis]|uniref:hypothetical protein n=1 Tax=Bacillus infantis TaxID=324767 RepID=UPI003CEFC456
MQYIDKELLLTCLRADEKFKDLLNDVENGKYDMKDYETLARSFIGKTLDDFYCNGFFGGRNYDLSGAEIMKITKSEPEEITIEVLKADGQYDYGYFDGGWCDWKVVYEHLDEWVNGKC